MRFNINLIKAALAQASVVPMVFEFHRAYIIYNGRQTELKITDDEVNMIIELKKEFRVYFNAIPSTCCSHVYNIRAAIS